jgi:hypothetical protein
MTKIPSRSLSPGEITKRSGVVTKIGPLSFDQFHPDWLDKNCVGHWEFGTIHDGNSLYSKIEISFSDENDAVMYKLAHG